MIYDKDNFHRITILLFGMLFYIEQWGVRHACRRPIEDFCSDVSVRNHCQRTDIHHSTFCTPPAQFFFT